MWQKFLQGEQNNGQKEDNSIDRCWTALRYTKQQVLGSIPAIRVQENGQEKYAATLEEKEKIFFK